MSFVFDVKIQFFATRSGINFGRGKETHVDHNWSESKKEKEWTKHNRDAFRRSKEAIYK